MIRNIKERFIQRLRGSEAYFKTDMVYLTHGGFWLSVGQAASFASSFILTVAFANLLPAETFGVYKYVISVAGLLAIPTLSGINNALTQAVARGMEGSFLPGFAMRMRWGALGSLGALAVAAYYFFNDNLVLAWAFAIAAPFIPLGEVLTMYGVLLSGRKLFRESTLYFLVSRGVYVIAMLITILLTDDIHIVLAAYFIPLTLTHLFLYLRTLKKYPPNGDTDQETLNYGVHISANGIIGQVGLYVDSILLWHFLGPVGVAVYSFAYAPMRQVRSAYKNITVLALPKLSARSANSIDHLLPGRLWKLSFIGAILTAAYICAAPFVFKIFFPAYLGSVFYSQLLALALIVELPSSLLWAAVQSRLHVTPRLWLYLQNTPTFVFIVVALVLVPMYGILGVISARLLSVVVSFGISWTQWVFFVRNESAAR